MLGHISAPHLDVCGHKALAGKELEEVGGHTHTALAAAGIQGVTGRKAECSSTRWVRGISISTSRQRRRQLSAQSPTSLPVAQCSPHEPACILHTMHAT
jgi:hypothetical protein